MKRLLSAALFLLILSVVAMGQGQLGVHFNSAVGLGEFQRVSDGFSAFGLNLEGGYQMPKTPITVGASFAYGMYGSDLQKNTYINRSAQTMRVRTNNNLINTNIFARIQPEIDFPIRPYIQGVAGYNFFYTREKVRTRLFEEILDATSLHGGNAFFYGLGAGLSIPIPELIAAVDLRVQHLRGGTARYLMRGDVLWNEATEQLDILPRRSGTEMLLIQIGIRFYLD
jgi:hypothetical protein